MMEASCGDVKPPRLTLCLSVWVELRTRAGPSMGFGDAALKYWAALLRAEKEVKVMEPLGFLPAPRGTTGIERIRKFPRFTQCTG